jgi:exopolysaccharide biosynthesis polyprenyl glycosylphosphotransferase
MTADASEPSQPVGERLGAGRGAFEYHESRDTAAAEVVTVGPDSVLGRSTRSTTLSPDTGADARTAVLVDASVSTAPQLAPTVDPARQSQRFLSWSTRYAATLGALDAVVGIAAVLIGVQLLDFSFDAWKVVVMGAGACLAWPLAIALTRGYERGSIGVGGDEMHAIFRALVLANAAGAVPSAVTGQTGVVTLCVMATPIAAVASLVARFAARKNLHRQQRNGENVRQVIVVGSAYAAADLATVLTREPHAGMRVLGVCVPRQDVARAQEAGMTVLGDLDQVPQLIETYGADAVAVTSGDATRHNYLRELSWSLESAKVELLVHPGLIEVAGPRMHIRPHVGLPLLHVEQPHFTGWRRIVKRAADLVLTGLGLLVISPLMLVIAAAVKLGDGGPVIFRQTRVGLDGSTFTMYKFRSMRVDAEARLAELRAANPGMGVLFKMEDDPRITSVGKFLRRFSLDELPQLFNVIGGSMSLVGPRPPLPSEVDEYEDHARRRLLVTPGLTGLWQVSGRSLLSWEETVRLDLRYVENWTLTLDLLIMWKTFFAVVAKRGAF